jgi:hypothetical protein
VLAQELIARADKELQRLKGSIALLQRVHPHDDAIGPFVDEHATIRDAVTSLEAAEELAEALSHVLAHGRHDKGQCADCDAGRQALAWWLREDEPEDTDDDAEATA